MHTTGTAGGYDFPAGPRSRRYTQKEQPSAALFLKQILVRDMLHNILYPASEKIAQLVDGIDLHILIVPQSIDL